MVEGATVKLGERFNCQGAEDLAVPWAAWCVIGDASTGGVQAASSLHSLVKEKEDGKDTTREELSNLEAMG